MEAKYKTSHKMYSAWNYMEEVEDLNRASEQGWQLVRGGCFRSRFVYNPEIRYRYQLDYRKIDDMARYIETFREQGWEYISSTFNGWHYFRKLYDPALPAEEYEIFTDDESLHEMQGRWARFALVIGLVFAACAVYNAVRMVLTPEIPRLVVLLLTAIESAFLLYGVSVMRNPNAPKNRRGGSTAIAIFLLTIILFAAAYIGLDMNRPSYYTQQATDSIEEPIVNNRWMEFYVSYTDNYYLDVDIDAQEPLTFEIVSEEGEVFYSVTETSFHEKDIRVRLPKGLYFFSMSCTSGFELITDID